MPYSTGRAVHRLDLRPWLVAAAGAAVLGAGVLAVGLHGKHWRGPGQVAAVKVAAGPEAAKPGSSAASSRAPKPLATDAQPGTSADKHAAEPAASTPDGTTLAPPVDLALPKPSFDVVRVDANGGAVIAGRAAPGAEVIIRDDGRELGRITADEAGQWVFLPVSQLAPGSRELTLAERTVQGVEVKAEASVLLVVPDRKSEVAANPTPLLAVLAPDTPDAGAAPRLLQPPPPVGIGTGARLGLDVVQYDDHGAISFAGSAPPRTPLRVYVDNRRIGDSQADDSGRWLLTPVSMISLGRHQVRVDQLSQTGRVNARVELPFARQAEPEPAAIAKGTVVVQPGENLWLLARHVYGAGPRFTVIYQANRTQIRDPRLIYPGQIFAVPDAPQGNPESSDNVPPRSG